MTIFRTSSPLHVRALIIFLLIAAVVGYAYYSAHDLIAGPRITLTSPSDGAAIAPTSLVTVAGTVQNTSTITLNDREIFITEEGAFSEQLLLPEGYTIITIKAWDKLGRTDTRVVRLVH